MPEREFAIRRATVRDREGLAMFLGQAYHPWGRFKFPERWHWQFVENPFRPQGELPVWLATHRGRIVGHVANTHVPFKVGGARIAGVNQCDLVVLPSYRRTGIAGALMEATLQDTDFVVDLWAAPITRRILERLGYLELPVLPWLCFHPAEGPFEGPDPEPAGSDARIEVVRVSRVGTDADALWEQIEGDFGLAAVRDSRYLNWKFTAQPFMPYEILEARQTGRLRGIAVVRVCKPPEPRTVVLGDLIAARWDAETLLALCRAVRRRYAPLRRPIVASTSVPEFREALVAAGFVETPRRRPVSPFLWCRRPRPDLPQLVRTMLVGRSDSDWDQYPYAGLA